MEFFTSAIISGIIYDSAKYGITNLKEYLSDQLKELVLSDEEIQVLEKSREEIIKNKNYTKNDFINYFESNENILNIINNNAININTININYYPTQEDTDYVLVVGGANIEYIYKIKNPLNKIENPLNKSFFSEKKIAYGGSGLNYTTRLLSAGIKVHPILPIGNDETGIHIFDKIIEAQKKSNNDYIQFNKNNLLVKGIKTIESLILTNKSTRKILSMDNKSDSNLLFNNFINSKLNNYSNPKIVMIGHIHSDKKNTQLNSQELITKTLIEKYHNRTLIYLNFGRNQLEYGYKFWEETIKKVGIIQFNLEEIEYFFKIDYPTIQFYEIIDMIKLLKVNTIITLDKLGALCITKDKDEGIIYAPEINIETEYKDKTGAGDAFASGLVYSLMKDNINLNNIGHDRLFPAIKMARTWATYTCTSLGSTTDCPTSTEINKYHENKRDEIKKEKRYIVDSNANEYIVDLIAKSYLKCI
jgi:sugar/nucleoside kinase (ribokinase family)